MKMNYEKPEVSYISFTAEAIMAGAIPRNELSVEWGVTTSIVDQGIADD